MSHLTPGLPDPVTTANIYCAGHLDDVIFRALKPFRDSARDAVSGAPLFLWMVRYARSGEHVKVRVHSSLDRREVLWRLLEEEVRKLFASLPATSPTEKIPNWTGAQAIDPEDRTDSPYPDRSLLWTTYRRSHVSLGPSPLIEDDRYTELCTLCLATATDLVFALSPCFSGELAYRHRHSTLIRALAAGIGALGLSPEEAAKYILYHRDWVLRVCALRQWWDHEQAARVIDLFERRLAEQALLDPTIALMISATADPGEGPEREWQDRLRTFFRYASDLTARTEEHLDPFAALPWYSPFFKVFQGLSNQLGLKLFDEAFLYHTLLSALKHHHSLAISTGYSEAGPELRAPQPTSNR